MRATVRRDGAILSHTWRVFESAEQTDAGVVVDGHLIDDATLEAVETEREYFGDEIYSRHFETDRLIDRLVGWF